jgi:hypothetical protein
MPIFYVTQALSIISGAEKIEPKKSGEGANIIKLFTTVIYISCNKLERLSLASLFSLVLCLKVGLEPPHVEHLSGAPLLGTLLALTHIHLTSLERLARDKCSSLL